MVEGIAMESITELKSQGNSAYSSERFTESIELYSAALNQLQTISDTRDSSLTTSLNELKVTLLTNRSASYLKLQKYQECIGDCTSALAVDNRATKALFRRASAYKALNEYKNSINDLQILLSISSTKEALNLLRDVRIALEKEQRNETEIKKILSYIQDAKDTTAIDNGLKSIINTCTEDKYHSLDFGRKDGVRIVNGVLMKYLDAYRKNDYSTKTFSEETANALNTSVLCLKAFISVCNHVDFVLSFVDFSASDSADDAMASKLLNFQFICSLVHEERDLARAAFTLLMYMFRSIPLQGNVSIIDDSKYDDSQALSTSHLFLQETSAMTFLRNILKVLEQDTNIEIQMMGFDILTAFMSDIPDFFSLVKEIDTRLESLEERKIRFRKQKLLKFRAQCHARWAVEVGLLDQLVSCLDSESVIIRQRAGPCFGRLLVAYNDNNTLKELMQKYIVHGPMDDTDNSTVQQIYEPSDYPPVEICRRRASVQIALLLQPSDELAIWALPQPGGILQLLLLISTNDERCQLIASEVLCLAASNENISPLLAQVVKSGALMGLMSSGNAAIRAAGVSTMTKLSIKSKALEEESPETSQILHTVLSVINSFDTLKPEATGKAKSSNENALVNFSNLDKKLAEPAPKPHEWFVTQSKKDNAMALTSVERAVEVLAAMVGKTHVKEELVHGSYRVAASMPSLLKLAEDLDCRSSAAYGLAHILASLTVTNHELRLKALAEKELSNEQYEQLKEIQRIKTTDEEGVPIEEQKEPDDPDTNILCRQRIKRLSQANAFSILIRLLNEGSPQTKEAAARSLAQMLVEESVRGAAIQQGLIKTCCNICNDKDIQKRTKIHAAHAIAKSLVTTNPHVLSEHLRISSFSPLLFLCKDSDAGFLEQFEALLSITNLLSCGEAEQLKFTSDKGIYTVHYLMFSDHLMVRRAAAEAFCNLANNENLLKMLRDPEKVRLWLGLSEDWDNEENPQEGLSIAKATSATLAMTVSDEEVAKAVIQENVSKTIVCLLQSENKDLIHRTLVIIVSLVQCLGNTAASHLLEGGVVPAISIVLKLGDENLASLARDAAQELSKAMKNTESS